jgi:predicted transposase YbfD/YdcC
MDGKATGGILRFFEGLLDPRRHNVIHKLTDIFVLALCGVICGADGWVEVEEFAKAKQKWFTTFLDLSGGIPSHDTFGRVFSRICPDELERCFIAWTTSLPTTSGGRLIAIDGKSIRRSFENSWDKSGMTHLVSAFVDANRIVFSQLAVKDKSNEIEAIPRLLSLLDLCGATVTIDAMGCQREIAQQIVEAEGDYVLSLKGNHSTLHSKIKAVLDEAILDQFKDIHHDLDEQVDGDHGRIETRRTWVTDNILWLGDLLGEWKGLSTIAVVESKREVIGGKTSLERRYFISSCKTLNAKTMAAVIRGHWSVENKLHWQLDVSFNEDQRRIRKHHGPQNFSRLCRLSLNLLKKDKSVKIGIHGKRLKAGWDEPYLLRLITT